MQTSSSSLFLSGLLATLALAAPSNIQKRTVTLNRVRNEDFQGHNGPYQLHKAYMKYGMTVPDSLRDIINSQAYVSHGVAASEKAKAGAGTTVQATNGTGEGGAAGAAGTGSAAAIPQPGDVEYLVPVSIGGQMVNLDADTGSADLWTTSTLLPVAQRTGQKALYDPTKSPTAKLVQGATYTISYGDGSGSRGVLYRDNVTIGGLSVENQGVEVATAMSQSFTDDKANQGLLGLCFSKINAVKPTKEKTWFENVMPQLAEQVFTADLRKGTTGAYQMGFIDNTKFTGPMNWVPVNTSSGFWQFTTAGYSIGGGGALKTLPASNAIADTGTTLMLVSKEVAQAYWSGVPGAKNDDQVGGITFPCKTTLPDLIMDVGGGAFAVKIRGTDINFANVDQTSELRPPVI